MTKETVERYRLRLQQYLEAEEAILSGAQSYKVGTRQLSRANLGEIAEMIKYLENQLSTAQAQESGGRRNKVVGAVPMNW